MELKEQQDLGNPYARHRIHYAIKRLHTNGGPTDWSDWWFEKRDDLWVKENNSK